MASSNLARVDSGDPQPTSTTAPMPSGPKASSAPVTLATPSVRLRRVVLCAQNLASASALRAALLRRGFEVRVAAVFHDLGGWLMLWDYSAVLVLELPSIDTFRKAVLMEARRLSRGVPLVALTKVVTADIERDASANGVVRVLPTDAEPEEIVTAVELAGENPFRESAAKNAPGDPEDGDIMSASAG